MRVVIAPDSFKGTLSAFAATCAMERGIKRASPTFETTRRPMADGGEGTMDVLMDVVGGLRMPVDTVDPLGRPIQSTYGRLADDTALIELAAASGLVYLNEPERVVTNALRASTFGTGIAIRRALEDGARRIIFTLGGSATSDGGYGLLAALGATYRDPEGQNLDGRDATRLPDVREVDLSQLSTELHQATFTILSDVLNPLCGPNGAAFIYGPQKGLDEPGVRQRDRDLARWHTVLSQALGHTPLDWGLPGLGAAGGASLPLMLTASVEIKRGAAFIADAIGLPEAIQHADWVVTGEGCTDDQSIQGKVVGTVASIAQRYGVPCSVISGALGPGAQALSSVGATDLFAASPTWATHEDLQVRAAEWLESTTFELFRRKVNP